MHLSFNSTMELISAEHIQYLQTHELEYEIRLRGVQPKRNRDDRRKQLRVIIRRQRSKIDSELRSPFSFAEDVSGITISLSSLQKEVEKLANDSDQVNFKRISARIIHLSSRAEFSNPKEETQETEKAKFIQEIFNLEGEFLEKEECFRIASISLKTPPSSPTPVSVNGTNNTSSPPAAANFSFNHVPVHKWNLTFSGESNESLTVFLERASELREARNVSESELLSSAVDLFSGPALIWFRSIKHTISTWPDLESLLRETFLPTDYNDELLAEIRKRTQGENEHVVMFIAHMQGLFAKLNPKPDESEQIRIIRKNLSPYFLSQLALQTVTSISQLTSLCKRLNETRKQIDNYHPPSSSNKSLPEPSLSYSHFTETSPSNNNVNNLSSSSRLDLSSDKIKCWNCRRTGHSYSDCRSPKSLFCYGCGRPDTFKPKCPACNPASSPISKNGQGEKSKDATPRPRQSRLQFSSPNKPTGAIPKQSSRK